CAKRRSIRAVGSRCSRGAEAPTILMGTRQAAFGDAAFGATSQLALCKSEVGAETRPTGIELLGSCSLRISNQHLECRCATAGTCKIWHSARGIATLDNLESVGSGSRRRHAALR